MYTCRECGRSFAERVDLALHRDGCVGDALVCRSCGARFEAARATRDGWHYRCPEPDCDAEGLGEGLRRVETRVAPPSA